MIRRRENGKKREGERIEEVRDGKGWRWENPEIKGGDAWGGGADSVCQGPREGQSAREGFTGDKGLKIVKRNPKQRV